MTYGPRRRRFRVMPRRPDSPVSHQCNGSGAGEGGIVSIRFVCRWNTFSIMLAMANPVKIDAITSWCRNGGLQTFSCKLIEWFSQANGARIIPVFNSINNDNTNRSQNAQIVTMKNYTRYFRGLETSRLAFCRKLYLVGLLLGRVQHVEFIP